MNEPGHENCRVVEYTFPDKPAEIKHLVGEGCVYARIAAAERQLIGLAKRYVLELCTTQDFEACAKSRRAFFVATITLLQLTGDLPSPETKL